MRIPLAAIALAITSVGVVPVSLAQAPRQPARDAPNTARFEIASVVPSRDGDRQRAPMVLPGGNFSMSNMPVRSLIAFAFGVRSDEVAGLPAWALTDRYAVTAKSAEGQPTLEQVRAMTRDLLRTRFQFASHEARRPMEVLALVPERTTGTLGPRLVRRTEPCQPGVMVKASGLPAVAGRELPCPGFLAGPGWMYVAGMSLPMFADLLSKSLISGTRLVDRSEIAGVFDITLEYAPPSAPGNEPSVGPPTLFVALRDQLGLKVESAQEFRNVLTVDRLERPTEN